MYKQIISDSNGTPVNIQTGIDGKRCLVTDGSRVLNAHWQSANITTATTTTIVEANPTESVMLTDLVVILSKKVAAATIVARFSDGTNTVDLFTFDAATASFQFSHAFQGGLRGWKDADFQIVTDDATIVGLLVGYVHVSPDETKSYSVWNAER
jgi:hypothetical protein